MLEAEEVLEGQQAESRVREKAAVWEDVHPGTEAVKTPLGGLDRISQWLTPQLPSSTCLSARAVPSCILLRPSCTPCPPVSLWLSL